MPDFIADGAQLSVGFVFSADGEDVLLIEKARPKFLAGLLNGSGGHAEGRETPAEAVSRETLEETEVFVAPEKWIFLFKESLPKGVELSFLAAISDKLHLARQTTDEKIFTLKVRELRPEQMAPGCLPAIAQARVALGFSPVEFLSAPRAETQPAAKPPFRF